MLTDFLKLFNPYPGNHYLQVTSSPDDTTKALDTLLQNVDGELSLVIYDENDIEKSKYPNIKTQHIKSFKQPFRAMPRDHDMVIFKDIFTQHKNQEMILKIAYTTLANTADIIIIEKKGSMDIEKIKDMLDKFEFRAVNNIDIHPDYDLVMAKKMHMWGNGL